MGTGRGFHLNRPAHPLGQGLLHPCGLRGTECCPSQSLLGNQPWVPLPGSRVHQCWLWLSAKVWSWKNRSGERRAVGCMDRAEGMGVRGCMAGNAPRGSVICLENKAPSLRGTRGVGDRHPHPPAPASMGTGRGSHQSEHAIVCCNCLPDPTVTGS